MFGGGGKGTGQDAADEACSYSSVHRSAFVRNLKTELSVATVKGNALVFETCLCQKDRQGVSERGNMPSCRNRRDPASHYIECECKLPL